MCLFDRFINESNDRVFSFVELIIDMFTIKNISILKYMIICNSIESHLFDNITR